jgi:hypothetical protein
VVDRDAGEVLDRQGQQLGAGGELGTAVEVLVDAGEPLGAPVGEPHVPGDRRHDRIRPVVRQQHIDDRVGQRPGGVRADQQHRGEHVIGELGASQQGELDTGEVVGGGRRPEPQDLGEVLLGGGG